jgi:hypothetical protein
MDLAAEVDNGLHKYFHLARQQLQVKSGGKGGIVVRGIKAVFLPARSSTRRVTGLPRRRTSSTSKAHSAPD